MTSCRERRRTSINKGLGAFAKLAVVDLELRDLRLSLHAAVADSEFGSSDKSEKLVNRKVRFSLCIGQQMTPNIALRR